MDSTQAGISGSAPPSSLRQPFIATANALAELYKRAGLAEREARETGGRTAYLDVLEWAARRSSAGELVTAQDVVAFATQRLADHPKRSPVPNPVSSSGGGDSLVPISATPQAVAGAGDTTSLATGIGKLQVNPRKRARVDLGDTFLDVWREEGLAQSLSMQSHPSQQEQSPQLRSPANSPTLSQSPEYDVSFLPIISSNTIPMRDTAAARKLNRKSVRETRPARRRDEE
jgi:hypothetical protein